MGRMKTTRGVRNNNPLNIRKDPNANWLGQVGDDGAFCVFCSLEYGFRAAFRCLRTYNKVHGIYKIEDIVRRWAPRFENDTEAYIEMVCRLTGRNREERVDVKHHYHTAIVLVRAMAKVETGCDYSYLDVLRGWELAFPDGEESVRRDMDKIDYLGILP